MFQFFKKYHRWGGIILVFFLVMFSFSGIIMNHRETFSGLSIPRNLLPEEYQHHHWNLGTLRATEKISSDSILIYGTMGIWLTNSTLSSFKDFCVGFPKGIDHRKIFKIHQTNSGEIFAGTQFGLYQLKNQSWKKVYLPMNNAPVVDLLTVNDTLYVLSRSYLFLSTDKINFQKISLPAPEGYDHKVGLFKTLWVIHSGEIYGKIGKLFVDLGGIIFIILSVGGLWMYIIRTNLKRKEPVTDRKKLKKTFKFNFKWHKKTGVITIVFLLITTITGIFLRPPLLVAIASARVGKIPFTALDTPNPWYDILRRIHYLPEEKKFMLITQDHFYEADSGLGNIKLFKTQPPFSVMGVNVLRPVDSNKLQIGSFMGIYEWNYKTGEVTNLLTGKPWHKPKKKASPVGEWKIMGYSDDVAPGRIYFDYDKGSLMPLSEVNIPDMPEIVKNTPLSLWNFSQEIHTGRIYRFFLGDFYILVVPLTGIFVILCLLTGFYMWNKLRKR
jgi:hypothetical protein